MAERYVVSRLLGQGGMGAVYEAHDTKLEREVALKVVLAAASNDARRRLEAEAKAVAALEHPGIVTLHDVLEHGDLLVLVLELVRGRSLRDMLEAGPLERATVVRAITGVGEALEAAHRRGFVHRDVKPDNVIMRSDGRTVLLDFGIAKAPALALPISPTVTADGTLVGTPAYLAPEQIRHEPVSAATDQFALAVTAYELATGRLPWNDASLPAIIASIVTDEPRSLRLPPREEDAAIDAVFARALSKDPAERYASVSDFVSALRAALVDGDAAGSPLPEPPSPSNSGRRARQELVTITAPPDAALPAPAPAPRSRLGLAALGLCMVALAGGLYWFGKEKPGASTTSSGTTGSVASVAVAPSSTGELPEALPISGAQSDEDVIAYRSAVQALRLGALDDAMKELDDAIRRRPDFGSAQLMRAYTSFMRAVDLDVRGREAFRAASAQRGKLSDRDAALLDALAPSFLDPPRWRESTELLDTFVREHPRDVVGWEALGFARTKLGDYAAADVAFDAEIQLDRRAALAYDLKAQFALARRDVAAATTLLETCRREVPSAVRCRVDGSVLFATQGRCREADLEARDALAVAPNSQRALVVRANANASLGVPTEVVAGFLEKRRALLPEELRRVAEIDDRYELAKRSGDFEAAIAALSKVLSSDTTLNGGDASRITTLAVETLWEAGRKGEATELAERYLHLEATRPLPERGASDATGRMLTFLFAAGQLSKDEFTTRRDKWVSAWRARRTDIEWRTEVGFDIWTGAYGAVGIPTAQEANDALRAAATLDVDIQPRVSVNTVTIDQDPARLVGVLLLSADRLDEAEPLLRAAAERCAIARDQVSRLALGNLLARRGKKDEACATYALIDKEWGAAKPQSVTLQASRAAASKLGCK
ncbi:MAG: protein kinase [Polyangiaceae bacterium]